MLAGGPSTKLHGVAVVETGAAVTVLVTEVVPSTMVHARAPSGLWPPRLCRSLSEAAQGRQKSGWQS